jgi:hypothetical protein
VGPTRSEDRVVLDYELKREYQEFRQVSNHDRPDSADDHAETTRRSRGGRESMACRTTTTRCISRTCGSNTTNATAGAGSMTSKSSRPTTAARTGHRRPGPGSPATTSSAFEAVAGEAVAGPRIPADGRTSCESAAAEPLGYRADHSRPRTRDRGLWVHRVPGAVPRHGHAALGRPKGPDRRLGTSTPAQSSQPVATGGSH